MKFMEKVTTGGLAVVGGAVAVVMAIHPTTLLAKGTCCLVGGALGLVVTYPLRKQIENLKEKIDGRDVTIDVLASRIVERERGASVLAHGN